MFDIDEFSESTVADERRSDALSTDFQRFAAELLRFEVQHLRDYPALGKDGGIDMTIPDGGERVFVQTKLASGGPQDANRAWQEEFKTLERNLCDPDGPPKGEPQYRPWFDDEQPISEYWFVTNANFTREEENERLRRQIRSDLAGLADKNHQLAHLRQIEVEVLGWPDIKDRLARNPALALKWFKVARLGGLRPLLEGDQPATGRFREFLNERKLPFYSLEAFRKQHPEHAHQLPDEENLLGRLETGEPFLVLTGAGGIGKTRLALELGRRARENEWVVLHVPQRWRQKTVEACRDLVSRHTKLLLIVDYLELHRDIEDFAERVFDDADPEQSYIRIVATCRESYYPAIEQLFAHQRESLSLSAAAHQAYQEAVVGHILEQAGLPDTPEVRETCRNLPVLAAMLWFIREIDRNANLEDLVGETALGEWVSRRVRQSFAQGPERVQSLLPRYMGLLDLPDPRPETLRSAEYDAIHDHLSKDGWIEKIRDPQSGEAWWTAAHDILADQIQLRRARDNPATLSEFIDDVFKLAERFEHVETALNAWQRLADKHPINEQDWDYLLQRSVQRAPGVWRPARIALLQTPLLNAWEGFRLVHGQLWDEAAERDYTIQALLAKLARQWRKGGPAPPDDIADAFHTVLHRAAACSEHGNHALTASLEVQPEATRDIARNWLPLHLEETQTHFAIRAWLDHADVLGLTEIRPYMRQWLETFRRHRKASFVYQSWLDAGGEPAFVKDPIRNWLQHYATDIEASFIYRSWLNAGGEPAFVKDPIRDWLQHYATAIEAKFVYSSWLDARGPLAFVRNQIGAWLRENPNAEGADHVFRAWLDARGEPAFVKAAIRDWLQRHATEIKAQFVYTSWLDAGGERAFVEPAIRNWLHHHATEFGASFVYQSWLNAQGELELVREAAETWLQRNWRHHEAVFLAKHLSESPEISKSTVLAILCWCAEHADDADAPWRLSRLVKKNQNHLKQNTRHVAVLAKKILQKTELHMSKLDDETALGFASLLFSAYDFFPKNTKLQADFDRFFAHFVSYRNLAQQLAKRFDTQRFGYKIHLLWRAVANRHLDLDRDEGAIRKFCEDIFQNSPNLDQELSETLLAFGNAFPHRIWDDIRAQIDQSSASDH